MRIFNKSFGISDIFNGIRLIILIICILFVAKILHFVVNRIGGLIPDMSYRTVFIDNERIVHEKDTIVRWFERIVQVPAKPETVYQNVVYPSKQKEMINYIKADGKKIRINTQYCDSLKGREFVYPYYPYFQIVSPSSVIFYRDYFSWERLSISVSYNNLYETEIKAISQLRFNPWSLSMSLYGTSEGKYGVEVKKRIW